MLGMQNGGMAEVGARRPVPNSPNSSPRGCRSPAVGRSDSSGTLRTTITLGKNPSVYNSGVFYLMKETPDQDVLTGSTNLIAHYGLEHSYHKISGRKLKEELSAFLPNLPGNIDAPASQDNSSLRSLIEKPPIAKELLPLSGSALSGFRLHPGPLPERYRALMQVSTKKKKRKKDKKEKVDIPSGDGGVNGTAVPPPPSQISPAVASGIVSDADAEKKKHKRQKKHDSEEKEKRKKKKEEKRRRKKKEEKVSESGNAQFGHVTSVTSSW